MARHPFTVVWTKTAETDLECIIGIIQYRELIKAPWRVIYRIDGNTVYVTSVFDGRRNLEDLLLERVSRD